LPFHKSEPALSSKGGQEHLFELTGKSDETFDADSAPHQVHTFKRLKNHSCRMQAQFINHTKPRTKVFAPKDDRFRASPRGHGNGPSG
jgi:hypothetical protein